MIFNIQISEHTEKGEIMGLSFRNKKHYVQFTTRYEEDLMERIRAISKVTGLSLNEIINKCVRYALDNGTIEKEK